MSYIRLSDNKYPITLDEIRQAHPTTGIPDNPTDSALRPLGYAVVTTATRPSTTEDQTATLATTPDSNNVLQWTVTSLTSSEVSQKKSDLINQINNSAENARNRYITPGSGQAMTYQEKLQEAKAYQAATSPTATNYPILNAEATSTGVSISTLANTVVTTYNQWIQIASKIEGLRQGANAKVKAATSVSTATTEANTAISNLDSI